MLGEFIIGSTWRFRLKGVKQANGTPVTALGGGESITIELVTTKGVSLGVSAGTHDAANPGTWYADVTLPSTPGIIIVKWNVVKAGATGKYRNNLKVIEG